MGDTAKKTPVEKNIVKSELNGGLTLVTFTVDEVARFRVEGVLTVENPPLSGSEKSHRLAGTAGGFQYTDDQLGINVQLISGVKRPYAGLKS